MTPPRVRTGRKQLFTRHPDNPLLTAQDWPYFVNSVFNPGAVQLASGETLLLCRVEDCSGKSHLTAARSPDGVSNWQIDPKPTLRADPENHPEEKWGLEDPRVVWLPELKNYAVTYTSYSPAGPHVSLALTEDFKDFDRIGDVMPPEDKNAAMLPRKIKGRWAMIHRPAPQRSESHIWISYSPDLRHWGDHTLVLRARRGPWWDANRVGLCTPLIETPEGWLLLYHGAKETVSGAIYRLGAALLDLESPRHCLLRSDEWLFGPEEEYERTGDVEQVVFPCGAILEDDGDTLHIYYGAADTSVARATGSLSHIMAWLKAHSRQVEADLT
ncbi:MAG: glycoside hydrolase family 130 protein [Planctomycetota bacterium]|jgi:predicted GH43/DUF377 family glycosyl hydrolase